MIIIVILIILILLIVKSSLSPFSSSFPEDEILKRFTILDENGKKINNLEYEIEEQRDALKYIEPSDIVLELGARYGSVSIAIAYKQNNSGKIVVVEPDESIIPALKNNMIINNSKFEIFNGYISDKSMDLIKDGYATRLKEKFGRTTRQITYKSFKKMYPMKFNVLIADCEGCLGGFFETIGDSEIIKFDKILFECDVKDKNYYDLIVKKLESLGFKVVSRKYDMDRYVLIKK